MTPNGEPTTEAGRAMLRDPMYRFAIGHTLAIEADVMILRSLSALYLDGVPFISLTEAVRALTTDRERYTAAALSDTPPPGADR